MTRSADLAVTWLGQAGFIVSFDKLCVLIDPYLSDSLAKKYAGTLFPHQRMMAPPLSVDELPNPDFLLITHAHTDHMDPETLQPLRQRFPNLEIIVPKAALSVAKDRIGSADCIRAVDADEAMDLEGGVSLTVFPAAHERFDRTETGQHPYLGYGVAYGGRRIYHSGDTVPFQGLVPRVNKFAPDVALLPINGRDAYRRDNGVPGNMNAKEAVALCLDAGIRHLIPHHFGMFSFNTADPQEVAAHIPEDEATRVTIPKPGVAIALS